MPNPPFLLSDEVASALQDGRPVVALESTIISHGLPRPRNLEAARDFESVLRDAGVVPATIAVLDGIPRVGLDDEGVQRIANEDMSRRASATCRSSRRAAPVPPTTVAATTHLAPSPACASSRRGPGRRAPRRHHAFDESADSPRSPSTRSRWSPPG